MIAAGVITALLAALLTTRLGVLVSYGTEGFRLWIVIGIVKKEIKIKAKSTTERAEKTESAGLEKFGEPKLDKSGKIKDFFLCRDKRSLISLGLRAIAKLVRIPRIDLLVLRYTAGGETADKAAMRYGRMCAALGAGLPFLEHIMRVKKRRISTNLDFSSAKQEFAGKLQVTVTLGTVFAFGIWLIIEFLRIPKKERSGTDGQQTENQ